MEGKRLYTPVLLSALPDTAKMQIEIEGTMVDNTHPQFKLAVLTRLCNFHWGELRQFGGVWRLAWGEYNPPAWAKKMKPQELTALERRTHFRHANLEIPTMHLHGAGHPSPGLTRPSSGSGHSGWWFLGSTWRCPPLVSADADMVIAVPFPCLWQQLDHEGALRHLVWNAVSGWSLQPHSGMFPWRWTRTPSTAFASVCPTAWATSVMQSGPWFLQTQRRQALRASTTLRTSTSRDDRIPLVATILICQVPLCTTASFAVGVPWTWAYSHQSVGTHGLVSWSSGDRPRCAFEKKGSLGFERFARGVLV